MFVMYNAHVKVMMSFCLHELIVRLSLHNKRDYTWKTDQGLGLGFMWDIGKKGVGHIGMCIEMYMFASIGLLYSFCLKHTYKEL